MPKNLDVHFSSSSDHYETPPEIIAWLEQRYQTTVTLDPCANAENTKAPKFFIEEQNGLIQSWHNGTEVLFPDGYFHTGSVFFNPPYSAVSQWVAKAYQEFKHFDTGNYVFGLVPARTDTKWWHEYVIDKATHIYYIKGRIKFPNRQKWPELYPKASNGAPFPSALVVWDGMCFATTQHIALNRAELLGLHPKKGATNA